MKMTRFLSIIIAVTLLAGFACAEQHNESAVILRVAAAIVKSDTQPRDAFLYFAKLGSPSLEKYHAVVREFTQEGPERVFGLAAPQPAFAQATESDLCVFYFETDKGIRFVNCELLREVSISNLVELVRDLGAEILELKAKLQTTKQALATETQKLTLLKSRLNDIEEIGRLALLKEKIDKKMLETKSLRTDLQNLDSFLRLTQSAPVPNAWVSRELELKTNLLQLSKALKLRRGVGEQPSSPIDE